MAAFPPGEADRLPGLFLATDDVFSEFSSLEPKRVRDGRNPVDTGIRSFAYSYVGASRRNPIYDRVGSSGPRKYEPIRQLYTRNEDVVPGTCERAMTSASAVALQALLRLGLADEQRVRRAINTLLSVWAGRWCGCGLLAFRCTAPRSNAPPDFNVRFPISDDNERIYRGDWFTDTRQMLGITGWRKVSPHYSFLRAGANAALVEKHSVGMGDCTLGVHAALSYHPGYPGSNLETMAALEYSRRQSATGRWGDTALSRMFHHLERCGHLLAAFLVLRSVPLLIRKQRDDGLWTDGDLGCGSAMPPEVASFWIVRALHGAGFLRVLVPDVRTGGYCGQRRQRRSCCATSLELPLKPGQGRVQLGRSVQASSFWCSDPPEKDSPFDLPTERRWPCVVSDRTKTGQRESLRQLLFRNGQVGVCRGR